jgi:hypothetical protein
MFLNAEKEELYPVRYSGVLQMRMNNGGMCQNIV